MTMKNLDDFCRDCPDYGKNTERCKKCFEVPADSEKKGNIMKKMIDADLLIEKIEILMNKHAWSPAEHDLFGYVIGEIKKMPTCKEEGIDSLRRDFKLKQKSIHEGTFFRGLPGLIKGPDHQKGFIDGAKSFNELEEFLQDWLSKYDEVET